MSQENKLELFSELILKLFQCNGSLLEEGDRLSEEQGLTGARWQVMGALHIEQKALTVAQIARRMGLQRQSVQRLADILVEQGLLAYRPNPEHKRAKLVDFTPRGRRTIETMEGIHQTWSSKIVSAFSQEELEQMVSLLQRLEQQLHTIQE